MTKQDIESKLEQFKTKWVSIPKKSDALFPEFVKDVNEVKQALKSNTEFIFINVK